MADTADEFLGVIGTIYQRWLTGELSQEDALFEIGDLLGESPGAPETVEAKSGAGPGD